MLALMLGSLICLLQGVIASICAANQPPIPADKVLGFPTRRQADDYLMAHPDGVLGAVHFSRSGSSSMNYIVQSNSTVRKQGGGRTAAATAAAAAAAAAVAGCVHCVLNTHTHTHQFVLGCRGCRSSSCGQWCWGWLQCSGEHRGRQAGVCSLKGAHQQQVGAAMRCVKHWAVAVSPHRKVMRNSCSHCVRVVPNTPWSGIDATAACGSCVLPL